MTDQPITDHETAQCWRNDPHQPHMWTWMPEDGGVDCPGIPAVTDIVHRRQPLGCGLMPCCGRTFVETPGERQTTNPEQVTCGRGDEVAEWTAEQHAGHGSPCETRPDGSCARPAPAPELREQIAEALMAWAERNNAPQYAAMRRPDTVRQNAYSRADAVLAVPAIQQLAAERDMLGRETDRLRRDWIAMRDRAEAAEAELQRLREESPWLRATAEDLATARAALARVEAECDRIEAAVRANPQDPDFDGAYLAAIGHIRNALNPLEQP